MLTLHVTSAHLPLRLLTSDTFTLSHIHLYPPPPPPPPPPHHTPCHTPCHTRSPATHDVLLMPNQTSNYLDNVTNLLLLIYWSDDVLIYWSDGVSPRLWHIVEVWPISCNGCFPSRLWRIPCHHSTTHSQHDIRHFNTFSTFSKVSLKLIST